jgi:hypothetical protein
MGWNAKFVDSVSMMEDGRYTRRMVVAQIIWNPVPITVEDRNSTLYIHDTKRTTLTLQRHALYRKLTDAWGLTLRGSFRPGLTGNTCFSIRLITSGGLRLRLLRRYSLQI